MRPLAALGLAGLFVLACVSLTKAQDASGQCVAKDQVIEGNRADGVKFRKIVGAEADVLRAFLDKINPSTEDNDLPGYTYVVFWRDGDQRAFVVGFDEHNCGKYSIKPPLAEIMKVIDGVGA